MVQHDGSVTRPEPRARRTRWGLRAGLATVLAAWLVLGAIGGPTVGRLSGVQENDNANFLPKQAESTLMNNESAKFVGSEALPYFVVIERDSGITPADQQKATAFLADVPKISVGDGKTIGDYLAAPAQLVIPSEDKRALLLTVQLNADRADNLVKDGETVLFAVADQMRNDIKQSLTPSGLKVYVTGPGGVLADFVVAFGGIDGILLGVALGRARASSSSWSSAPRRTTRCCWSRGTRKNCTTTRASTGRCGSHGGPLSNRSPPVLRR